MRIIKGPLREEDCKGYCSNCMATVLFHFLELLYYRGTMVAGADPRYWECPVCKTRNHEWEGRK